MKTENKIIIGSGIATILFVVGISFLLTNSSSNNTSIPDEQVITRNGLHWHPKLSIAIKGQKQELTDGIGLGAVHQRMHTHTEDYKDGVVHMEMSDIVTKDETRLGNFFRIWGKEFNSSRILDKVSSQGKNIRMIVNGNENKEFENYLMKDGDKIEIIYK